MTKQQQLPRVAYDTSLTSSCEFFLSITPQSDLWEKSLTRCGFSSGWLCSSPGLPILYSVICAHGGWLTPMTSWALPSLWDTGTSHAPHSQEVALRGGRLTFSRSGEKTLSPYSYFLCLCCAALHSLIVILIFFFSLQINLWGNGPGPESQWQFLPSIGNFLSLQKMIIITWDQASLTSLLHMIFLGPKTDFWRVLSCSPGMLTSDLLQSTAMNSYICDIYYI